MATSYCQRGYNEAEKNLNSIMQKAGCANGRTEQGILKERREEIYPLTVCRYLHYLSTPFTVLNDFNAFNGFNDLNDFYDFNAFNDIRHNLE